MSNITNYKLKRTFTRSFHGKSTFICRECGKRTRDTGRGEDGRYCWRCVEILETENAHLDGVHDELGPSSICRMCQEQSAIINQKSEIPNVP